MAIYITCDMCGSKMGTATDHMQVRDFMQKRGKICGKCEKKEESLLIFYAKHKDLYVRKLDKALNLAKKQLATEIAKIAGLTDEKEDSGDEDV